MRLTISPSAEYNVNADLEVRDTFLCNPFATMLDVEKGWNWSTPSDVGSISLSYHHTGIVTARCPKRRYAIHSSQTGLSEGKDNIVSFRRKHLREKKSTGSHPFQ